MSLLHENTSSTIKTFYSQCIESITSHDAIEQSLQADLQTHLQELKLELPDPEYQLLKTGPPLLPSSYRKPGSCGDLRQRSGCLWSVWMNKYNYSVLKNAISASCCSSLSRPASSSRVRCTGVREKEVSSVEKNWARVIPNA